MSTTPGRIHSTSAGRRGRPVLAVTVLAALSVAATACGGGDRGEGKDAAEAGVTYSTAPKQSAELAGRPDPDPESGTEKADSGAPDCKASDLEIKGFSGSADGDGPLVARTTLQQHTAIGMKNTSDRPCVLDGFPGVTFEGGKEKDPADRTGRARWDLPRSGGKAEPVTVEPGSAAWAPLTFLSEGEDADKDGWYPKKIEITPPNGTRPVTLDWPWGNIHLQDDGAPRSGTFVHPVSAEPGTGR